MRKTIGAWVCPLAAVLALTLLSSPVDARDARGGNVRSSGHANVNHGSRDEPARERADQADRRDQPNRVEALAGC
jgi:hypothetical protein